MSLGPSTRSGSAQVTPGSCATCSALSSAWLSGRNSSKARSVVRVGFSVRTRIPRASASSPRSARGSSGRDASACTATAVPGTTSKPMAKKTTSTRRNTIPWFSYRLCRVGLKTLVSLSRAHGSIIPPLGRPHSQRNHRPPTDGTEANRLLQVGVPRLDDGVAGEGNAGARSLASRVCGATARTVVRCWPPPRFRHR